MYNLKFASCFFSPNVKICLIDNITLNDESLCVAHSYKASV